MDLITISVSFISGLLSSMGFGGGSVLIIFLTSFLNIPQKQAQGMNLMFFIPCAIYSVLRYNKDNLIDKRLAKQFIFYGIIGVISGYIILKIFPSSTETGRIFGIFLIIFGIKDLFAKRKGTSDE